jgi:hypothetical protein
MAWILALVVVVLAAAAFVSLSAPRWRRWGATDAELAARYPHDDLVPNATMRAVRAVTVDAPVKDVWPWIAQIGRGAGWNSIDFLDNQGCQSADYIMDIPPPAIGDRSGIGPLASFATDDHLAYLDASAAFLFTKWRFGFGHVLRPLGADRTRVLLMTRALQIGGPPFIGRFAMMLNDVMEIVMGVAQLKNLKRLIESYPARRQAGDINKSRTGGKHQKAAFAYAGQPNNG